MHARVSYDPCHEKAKKTYLNVFKWQIIETFIEQNRTTAQFLLDCQQKLTGKVSYRISSHGLKGDQGSCSCLHVFHTTRATIILIYMSAWHSKWQIIETCIERKRIIFVKYLVLTRVLQFNCLSHIQMYCIDFVPTWSVVGYGICELNLNQLILFSNISKDM